MTHVLRLGAAAIAALAAAVSLPSAEAETGAGSHRLDSCFYTNQVGAFTRDGERTLYARVGGRGVYRFDLRRDCVGLESDRIVMEPPPSGSICSPIDVTLTVGDHGVAQRCDVDDIVRLSPDEVAALPKRLQP